MLYPKLIQLPKILDKGVTLCFFENTDQLHFEIKVTNWIFDGMWDEIIGGHAFTE